MKISRIFGGLLPAAASLRLYAAETAVQPAPSAISAGSILQMILGLAVVLALVLACAWLMKRLQAGTGGSSGVIRVIAGAAVGQRERVVLLEVAGTWLVVGVAPGQVRALHTMPRGEVPGDSSPAAAPPFADWLKRTLEKRGAR